MLHMIEHVFIEQSLVAAFAVVGAVMWLSLAISRRFTAGRVHGSAIAIVAGLVLAYAGGLMNGGQKGLADVPVFAGIGLMGGAMLRDFAIVATAFEVDVVEARRRAELFQPADDLVLDAGLTVGLGEDPLDLAAEHQLDQLVLGHLGHRTVADVLAVPEHGHAIAQRFDLRQTM